MADRLRGYGARPLEVPTIAVELPRTPAPMDRAIKGLVSGRYQWIAFTSVNAVKAMRDKLDEFGLDARAFAGVRIAAVGESTAAALRALRHPAGARAQRSTILRGPARRLAALRQQCSTPSTGCCCLGPTSRPKPSPRG